MGQLLVTLPVLLSGFCCLRIRAYKEQHLAVRLLLVQMPVKWGWGSANSGLTIAFAIRIVRSNL